VNQQGRRASQPARPVQHVQYSNMPGLGQPAQRCGTTSQQGGRRVRTQAGRDPGRDHRAAHRVPRRSSRPNRNGPCTAGAGAAARRAGRPTYTRRSPARTIDGHLLRTGQDVYAWYRLGPQRWSFRSDSQRQDLIEAIAGQYAELQGRWMHLRVTTRRSRSACGPRRTCTTREPAAGHLGRVVLRTTTWSVSSSSCWAARWREGGLPGVQVQTRRMVDRAVERAAPLLRRIFPDAGTPNSSRWTARSSTWTR